MCIYIYKKSPKPRDSPPQPLHLLMSCRYSVHRGTTPKRTAMPFQRSTALAAPPSTLALRLRMGWGLPVGFV